jgi:ABC-type multidrug transport system fused ATPase/permease subunit
VSSLKKDRSSPPSTSDNSEDELGFVDASFRWNEVPEEKDEDKNKGKDAKNGKKMQEPSSASTAVDETGSTVPTDISDAGSAEIDLTAPDEDRRFELKDLNIRFPEGELTLVTGPTASGKTAILVRLPVACTLRQNEVYVYRWRFLEK